MRKSRSSTILKIPEWKALCRWFRVKQVFWTVSPLPSHKGKEQQQKISLGFLTVRSTAQNCFKYMILFELITLPSYLWWRHPYLSGIPLVGSLWVDGSVAAVKAAGTTSGLTRELQAGISVVELNTAFLQASRSERTVFQLLKIHIQYRLCSDLSFHHCGSLME